MGILNVTPDSFSDGNKFLNPEKAIAHAKQMVEEGADIIDIGAESSRPGSDPVSEEEELQRLLPIVSRLVKEIDVPISIDTYKPQVAEACLTLGAHMINDISGLRNKEMITVVSKHKVPVIIMHMLGDPKTMQENPMYTDIVQEIKTFFEERIQQAKAAGITDIILDPGIGFGKTVEHNLDILNRLKELDVGYPLLIGPSRKSFIGHITGLPVEERLEGTIAAVCVGLINGASIFRVHDVTACKRALQIVDAIQNRNY